MACPSVVLPEPDLPTTPTVWPSRTASDTPSTAFTWPTVRRKKPRLIGNQTRRFSVLAMVGALVSSGGGSPLGSAASSACV